MKTFAIGKQTVEAQVVSEGTYLSEKSGATLRQMTITFDFQGEGAGDRYNALEREANANGLASDESDPEEKVLWELYDTSGSAWQRSPDNVQYVAFWEIKEKEDRA